MSEILATLAQLSVLIFDYQEEYGSPARDLTVGGLEDGTIEAADHVYGVTMQEPGVSTLVALELKDLPRGQVA